MDHGQTPEGDRPIRVLIAAADPTVENGANIQIRKTAEALRELGLEVTVGVDTDFPEQFDLIHAFGIRPALMRRWRQAGVPIALSTVYSSVVPRPFPEGPVAAIRQLRASVGFGLRQGLSRWRNTHEETCRAIAWPRAEQRAGFELADLLLPNSNLEGQAIHSELGATTPYHAVPNAVDPAVFNLEGALPWGERKWVVYSGRIEPRKNQLGLIEALRDTPFPLRIIGPVHPDFQGYAEQCRRRLGPRMEILPPLPHAELAAVYHQTRVHALPSYGETTGLSSLEAALCGANVVTTERYFTREYFQEYAWYCQYQSKRSIRQAVEAAYRHPFREELRQRVLERYTWAHTAAATCDGYHRLLTELSPLRRPRG